MVELPQRQPTLGQDVSMGMGLGMGLGMGPGFAMPSLNGQPMMLPSLSMQTSMLPSMDPQMTQQVANQYGQTLLQQNVSQLQEMMQLSANYSATMKQNVQSLSSVAANIQQIDALLAGALQGLRATSTSSQAQGGGGGGGAAPGQPTEGAEPAPTDPSDTRTLRQRFNEGRQNGQTVSGVTRRMAGAASNALSQRNGRWSTTPDEQGNLHFYDPSGNITDSMPATEENIATATRYGARTARATGLLNRYSAGESLLGGEGGLGGGLGAGLLKVAGPIGMAVTAVDQGFRQFANQTEAGTQYRAAYGTDAGRFAFSDRAHADLAGIGGYFSGIGFGRGQRNFETAAALGLTGDARSQGADFMNTMYSKLGIDTQQSAAFVQMAAQNTSISLKDLSDQIMRVSEAAVDAGRNSEQAVQSYLAVSQQLQASVTDSGAAPAAAAALAVAQSQNYSTNLNTTQLAQSTAGLAGSQQNLIMAAQRLGVDPGTFQQQVALGTGNTVQQAIGASQDQIVEFMSGMLGGRTSDQVRSDIRARYHTTDLSPNQMREYIAPYPAFQAPQLVAIAAQMGLQIPEGQAIEWYFQTLLNNSGFGQDGKPGGTRDPQMRGAGSQLFGSGGGLSSAGAAALGVGPASVAGSVAGRYGGGAAAMSQSLKAQADPVVGAYEQYAKTTGNRDLAAEKLIRNADKITAYTGKSSLSDVKLTMADGSQKSITEIMSDPALMAQVDQGTPIVHGKNPHDTKDLSEFLPGVTRSSAATAGAAGSSVSSGGFTLSLTGYAEKLFNLSGPSDAQSSGTPPVGTVNPDSYAR